MMKFIDLSHTVIDNMPVFPGDPAMLLKQIASVGKEGYTDHLMTTNMHVATHIDAPLHMISGGEYISELEIEKFIGPGVLIDARDKIEITADVLKNSNVKQGSIVLLFTGYSSNYKTPLYDSGYPKINLDFAEALVRAKVNILGIDFINPDTEEAFPIHKKLLGNEILIIENLTNLEKLLKVKNFEVLAIPPKLHADAAPVRVVARIL